MSKRSLVAMILMMCMSLSLLVGCGGDESTNGADNSEVSSVVEDVNSEANESEEVSEAGSEENEEVASEEVAEEVDYSAEAVMGLIDELIAKYPDENADYIKALVIAMNLDYMTGEDVDAVMSTYGYSFEQLNENFVAALEKKYEIYFERQMYMDGMIDEYEHYEETVQINECCLNLDDINNLKEFEEIVAFSSREDMGEYKISVIEQYNESKIHYIVIMMTMDHEYRIKWIPNFDEYNNVVSEYANAL